VGLLRCRGCFTWETRRIHTWWARDPMGCGARLGTPYTGFFEIMIFDDSFFLPSPHATQGFYSSIGEVLVDSNTVSPWGELPLGHPWYNLKKPKNQTGFTSRTPLINSRALRDSGISQATLSSSCIFLSIVRQMEGAPGIRGTGRKREVWVGGALLDEGGYDWLSCYTLIPCNYVQLI